MLTATENENSNKMLIEVNTLVKKSIEHKIFFIKT